MKRLLFAFWYFGTAATVQSQQVQKINTQLLVVGGGTGGTAAAIQAARNGVQVVLVENGPWLGGMLTSAGVSAVDGNHQLPSGLWKEFRDALYKVYGGPNKLATGWVSNTQFEPRIGDSIFKAMVQKEKNITVYYGYQLRKVQIVPKKIIEFSDKRNKVLQCSFRLVIDATELGDLMAMAKIPFDIGMESGTITGENVAAVSTNDILQDLTYTAIIKDYGKGTNKTIAKPVGYDPMEFDGICKEWCRDTVVRKNLLTASKMLDYARLPNGKILLNWPNKGNDMFVPANRLWKDSTYIQDAKNITLRFIYFIQKQLGFTNLGLVTDEFPTPDHLPIIPYYREGRRLQGLVRFKVQHVKNPYDFQLYKTGIAVGDYPIDHHHKKYRDTVLHHLNFPPVPSYTIPLGALIPKNNYPVIVAEKGISVSNIVNGTTRLQPVVLLTGQAAGALAALCIRQKIQPAQVNIRQLQQQLLQSKVYLQPYIDVPPQHPYWESIQKTGSVGCLKAKGIPFQWANQTWFYPDSLIYTKDIDLLAYDIVLQNVQSTNQALSIKEIFSILRLLVKVPAIEPIVIWKSVGLTDFDWERKCTRAEFAVLLDKYAKCFEKKIDFSGHFVETQIQ